MNTTQAKNRAGEKHLSDYCARYAINRPLLAPAVPNLIVATVSGVGNEVYNRDGGGIIAVFSSTEAARKAVRKLTGVWP